MVDVDGPPVSSDLRGVGWAEVLAARAVLAATPDATAKTDSAARTTAGHACAAVPGAGVQGWNSTLPTVPRGRVEVDVWAGEILCPVTLRSYALGAVHQALGMVWSEGIALDAAVSRST